MVSFNTDSPAPFKSAYHKSQTPWIANKSLMNYRVHQVISDTQRVITSSIFESCKNQNRLFRESQKTNLEILIWIYTDLRSIIRAIFQRSEQKASSRASVYAQQVTCSFLSRLFKVWNWCLPSFLSKALIGC